MDLMPDLERDMIADRIIITHLENKELAREFYAAMCNMRWEKIDERDRDQKIIDKLKGINSNIWSISWRGSGRVIAGLRNMFYNTTEDYIDFYCGGNEGLVSPLVEECFNRIGWKQCPWEEEIV